MLICPQLGHSFPSRVCRPRRSRSTCHATDYSNRKAPSRTTTPFSPSLPSPNSSLRLSPVETPSPPVDTAAQEAEINRVIVGEHGHSKNQIITPQTQLPNRIKTLPLSLPLPPPLPSSLLSRLTLPPSTKPFCRRTCTRGIGGHRPRPLSSLPSPPTTIPTSLSSDSRRRPRFIGTNETASRKERL